MGLQERKNQVFGKDKPKDLILKTNANWRT